jgi:predicted amidohydrolase
MEAVMKSFNIALLQQLPTGSQYGNIQKGIDACRSAKAMGAELALFPEMWNTGYCLEKSAEETREHAVAINSEYINSFRSLAKELDMAIGITFLEDAAAATGLLSADSKAREKIIIRNSLALIDRQGQIVLHYAKVHTCAFDPTEWQLTAGDDFYVADLNTKKGSVKIGAMICFDREFPESARILMLKGAELLLVPNACPMEINRLSQLRTRAFENMVGIATVNYPFGQPDCNGHSTAFDGIAYHENDMGSRDMLIIEAGEQEGIYLASFPMGELRDYRRREVWGNAYRKPEKYQALTSKEI